MKKVIAVLAVLALLAGVSWLFLYNGVGCYKSIVLAGQNSRNIAKLKTGITKQDVLKIMGPPNKIEVYAVGSRVFEFLLYRTKSFDIIFKDKGNNFTPVGIDSLSGVVLSLDRQFYNDILNARGK